MLTKPLIMFLLPPSTTDPSTPTSSYVIPLLANNDTERDAEAGNKDAAAIPPPINLRRPSSLCMLLTRPIYGVHYYWRRFDDSVMRPVFGGRPDSPEEEGNLH